MHSNFVIPINIFGIKMIIKNAANSTTFVWVHVQLKLFHFISRFGTQNCILINMFFFASFANSTMCIKMELLCKQQWSLDTA